MITPIFAASEEASAAFGPLDFAIAGSLLFWALVCFLIYYFVLAPMMMKRSEALIQDRDNTVKGDLASAEKANADATKLLEQYESKLETARAEASNAVRAVLAEAEKNAVSAENRVSKKIAKNAAESDDRINDALAAASSELTESAADIAQAAVARLAGLKVTKSVAKTAVKASG